MGGSHTQVVVSAVWQAVFGDWHFKAAANLNEVLRKVGHFFGYGMISLLFRNAWFRTLRLFPWFARTSLVQLAGQLAVLSTFLVGCLDEWHQTFLPGRVGCLRDALLDTTGALVLNVAFWALYIRKRKQAIARY
jgi:VanZ family protein